jgi:hypothetical protein
MRLIASRTPNARQAAWAQRKDDASAMNGIEVSFE